MLKSCVPQTTLFYGILFFSLGIAVGHVYYVLEDVFPLKPGGFRILQAPDFM